MLSISDTPRSLEKKKLSWKTRNFKKSGAVRQLLSTLETSLVLCSKSLQILLFTMLLKNPFRYWKRTSVNGDAAEKSLSLLKMDHCEWRCCWKHILGVGRSDIEASARGHKGDEYKYDVAVEKIKWSLRQRTGKFVKPLSNPESCALFHLPASEHLTDTR